MTTLGCGHPGESYDRHAWDMLALAHSLPDPRPSRHYIPSRYRSGFTLRRPVTVLWKRRSEDGQVWLGCDDGSVLLEVEFTNYDIEGWPLQTRWEATDRHWHERKDGHMHVMRHHPPCCFCDERDESR